MCLLFSVTSNKRFKKRSLATSSTVRCRRRSTRTQHTVALLDRTRHIHTAQYNDTYIRTCACTCTSYMDMDMNMYTRRDTQSERAPRRVFARRCCRRGRARPSVPSSSPHANMLRPLGRWRGGRESGAHRTRVRRATMQHGAALGLRSAVSSSGPVEAVLRPVVVRQSAPETQAECVRRAPGRCAVCRDMGGRGGEMGNRSGKEARSRKGRAWLARARAVAH